MADSHETTYIAPTVISLIQVSIILNKSIHSVYVYSYVHTCIQSEVYHDLGQPLLEKALEGYNATIFAYGQVHNMLTLHSN